MSKYVVWWLAGACLVVVLSGGVLAREGDPAVVTANAGRAPDTAQVRQRMSTLAVPFEANTGQQDQHVAFTARTLGGTLFVTRAGVLVYSFPGLPVAGQGGREAIHKRGPGWVLTETLIDARPVVRGDAPSATRVSRFIGNDPKRWQTSIPTFDRVALGETWPGIEVALAARGNNVEKLFTVAPGADATRIAISLRGAERLELAADGALVAHTGNGPVSFTTPRGWQDIKGERKPVRVAYTLAGDRYGFRLPDYDPAYPVVIDPIVQSTYLGVGGDDEAYAIAVNASGDVYVTGYTDDTYPDFLSPLGISGSGAQHNPGGGGDAFVVRLSNDLKAPVLAATYLGGSDHEHGNAITVHPSSGDVFVAGYTKSSDFPMTNGGVLPNNNTGADKAFVVKLKGDLTAILQATYLGGSNGTEHANGIALNAGGDVLVVGYSSSSTGFPGITSSSPQQSLAGATDAFVALLGNGLTTIVRSTYLGGVGDDSANAIALGANGDVFVVGNTTSLTFPNFPNMGNAAQSSNGGGNDAFVVKLKGDLTAILQATYLGGSGTDNGNAIALDANGFVFVAGDTRSQLFPGVSSTSAQSTFGAASSTGFIAKLNNGLTAPIRATYLGNDIDNVAHGIALDPAGNVFVTGFVIGGSVLNFPGTPNGALSTGSTFEAFVARLDNDLNGVTQATYLGGDPSEDRARAIAMDANGFVFVAGYTTSMSFSGVAPTSAQNVYAGGPYKAFVSKLTHGLHGAPFTATNDGDPHITTVEGIHYDFQGAGEFIVLGDGSGTQIQTRQSPVTTQPPYVNPYTGLATCVSLNTAIAARVGTHRVTYQPSLGLAGLPGTSGMQLRVDGVLTTLGAQPINLGPGARVMKSAAGNGIEIDFPDGTNLTATSNFWGPPHNRWYINLSVFSTEATEGIMGALASGSWLPALPNGTSLGPKPAALPQRYVDLYQKFANAWRVTNATSLFDYAPGTSTATFTLASWPPENPPCVVPDSPPTKPVDANIAQRLCAQIVDKNRKADCIFDVGITGEPGFAKLYLVSQQLQAGSTRTTLNDNKNPTLFGEAVTFTATVALRASSGKGIPTGTVQFSLDGAKTGNPVKLNAKGQAKWSTSSLAVGNHRVGAQYIPAQGSAFLASSSLDKPHAVSEGALEANSLTVKKTVSAPPGLGLPNFTGVVFPVNIACTPFGPRTSVTLTAANPSQAIPNIRVGSTCNVTEPPVQQTGTCGRPLVGVALPPTYVPGQNVPILRPPAAPSVEVHNVIGCVPVASSACVLDPGMVAAGNTFARRATLAQTFTPTRTGSLTTITHGLQSISGVHNYDLLVTTTTGGLPSWTGGPYTTPNVLLAMTGVTIFSNSGIVNGVVQIPPSQQPHLTAGTQYALILIPGTPTSGNMAWRGNSGAGSYPNGSAYELNGTTWSVPGTGPKDHGFKLGGLCAPVGSGSLRVEKKMAPTAGAVPPIPPGIVFPVQVACTPNGPKQTVNLAAGALDVMLPNIIAGSACTITELPPQGALPPNCRWDAPTYPLGQSATIQSTTVEKVVQNSLTCEGTPPPPAR
jgi:hypothetical protein